MTQRRIFFFIHLSWLVTCNYLCGSQRLPAASQHVVPCCFGPGLSSSSRCRSRCTGNPLSLCTELVQLKHTRTQFSLREKEAHLISCVAVMISYHQVARIITSLYHLIVMLLLLDIQYIMVILVYGAIKVTPTDLQPMNTVTELQYKLSI